jgi:hypothetical protein
MHGQSRTLLSITPSSWFCEERFVCSHSLSLSTSTELDKRIIVRKHWSDRQHMLATLIFWHGVNDSVQPVGLTSARDKGLVRAVEVSLRSVSSRVAPPPAKVQ